MNKRGMVFLLLLLCLPFISSASDSAASLYNEGNSFYEAGDFQKAAEAYEQVRATGIDNPALEYNLGNARLKNGRLSKAILSYLRAQRMAPRDPDVIFNLEFARSQIKGEAPQVPRSSIVVAFDAVVGWFTLNELSAALSLGWTIFFTGLIVRIITRSLKARSLAWYVTAAGLVLMLLGLPFFASKVQKQVLTENAVILDETVEAHSGPSENNAKLFELYEGMEVIIIKRDAGWSEIKMPGGLTGWIPQKTSESI